MDTLAVKILYVANHGCGGNDDEGAVLHALQQLGHEVTPLHQDTFGALPGGDLLLFHKFQQWKRVIRFQGRKAFWYFDLVDIADPTLQGRCQHRKDWIERASVYAKGFCTDGDWAADHGLTHLPQGADERTLASDVGPGGAIPVLFTGSGGGGIVRTSFLKEMRDTYGTGFVHMGRCYREELRTVLAGTTIVVAPDGPVTPRYCSNRVYTTLGLGGFLLHPYCEYLRKEYSPDQLVMYRDRAELHELIARYTLDKSERLRIARSGLYQTKAHHTYRHRLRRLLECLT